VEGKGTSACFVVATWILWVIFAGLVVLIRLRPGLEAWDVQAWRQKCPIAEGQSKIVVSLWVDVNGVKFDF
jgi:hypothetical protein